jgi:steroid delta-isomerase-like uncharacterized protein
MHKNDPVLRYFKLWNERRLELADELFAQDFVAELVGGERSQWDGRGPESVKSHVLAWLRGMPDLELHDLRNVRQGASVVTHWQITGTHKGMLYGVVATGLSLRATGVTWFELEGPRIARMRIAFDALGFLQQLGALPDTTSILAGIAHATVP